MKSNQCKLALAILLLSLQVSIIQLHAFPFSFPNITNHLPNLTSPPWEAFNNFAGCQMGDSANGLAKLKQYFNKFGYIPDTSTNFTDDFDEILESALKTYQQNFNLNPTGTLDKSTLQQIVRPRCGVADIINGTSTMNSGKPTTSSSSIHSVAHFTFFPNRPRWPSTNNRPLTYAFFPGNQLTDPIKQIFSRAFSKWSSVTPLTFQETKSFGSADITIGFFSGDHGDGEPFDGILGTLAHAFSPTNGRFHLDADENWVTDDDVSTSSLRAAVDLESVAVHEIGHLLGLGHSSVEEAIMFPTISTGMRKVDLMSDDVQGIQMLYGSNPNFNGSIPSTTSQQRDTNSGQRMGLDRWGTGMVMLFGLLLALCL